MPVIINPAALKYRETTADPWQTLTIYTEKDIAALADVFSTSSTYVVGEIVMHEGIMYKCTTAVTTAGAWTGSANWAETTVEAELASLRNTLTQVENGLAIPQTGDTASRSIPAGAFIFLQEHSTLADGIYQNTSGSAIGSGATFTTSNLTRCYQETGALNSLYGSLANIANIETGTNRSSSVSVPTDTATVVSTVSLTKGVWLLIGAIDWASNANGYRQASFSDGLNPGREFTTCVGSAGSGKETYTQVVTLISVSTSETVSLYGRQDSGSALNAYPYIGAIQFKG